MKKIKNLGMAAVAAVLMMVSASFNECPVYWIGTFLLPNPANCSTFYSCSDGVPILMHCPDGLHFNAELDVCDWPENAGCMDDYYEMICIKKGAEQIGKARRTGVPCTYPGCSTYGEWECISGEGTCQTRKCNGGSA